MLRMASAALLTWVGVASRKRSGHDRKSAYRKLNAELGLPAGARIVAIDGEPVQSARQITERLGAILAHGQVPMKLEFEDRAGSRSEIYLTAGERAEAPRASRPP